MEFHDIFFQIILSGGRNNFNYVIFQVPFLGHRDGVGGTGGSENVNFPFPYVEGKSPKHPYVIDK